MGLKTKLWTGGLLGCMAALILAAILLGHSFRLTAFSDVIQCLLLLSGTVAFLARALRTKARMRLFWGLMTLGLALWLSYQLLWTYFEVVLRTDVPDIFSGDIVIFVHIVPLIAALALRPHLPRDQYAARVGHLDFALLFVWWVYLYVLLVMAWQYASPELIHYSHNLNAVYLVEKLFFLGAVAACWAGSSGRWKTFYANLFAASLTYATSSYIANWAISRKVYYSGSLYDIPLAASMTAMSLVGMWSQTDEPATISAKSSSTFGVWVARFGMIAAFSLPLFGAWTLFDFSLPSQVRSFRVILTLATALIMGVMVFTRQRLLDRELIRLLNDSRESFENLKRLQAQILQSEKMASIGQLVGGAAHELNNPITAMLGYSDLLLSTELSSEQQTLATKISQNVRRTRSLVAGLLSFARQTPAFKTPLDLNTLARTAVKLTQPQWQPLNIEVGVELDPHLPRLLGDSNQLLQVCLQLLSGALHSTSERDGHNLTITTKAVAGLCTLTIVECVSPRPDEQSSGDCKLKDAVGLTACQGIIEAHQGRISTERGRDGCVTVRIELPGIPSGGNALAASFPVLWSPRPSV
ncbi:MAG TPA: HAMP domain-containing sensor histidine kinase [Candidatus Sulfotelmatobacter sp.]